MALACKLLIVHLVYSRLHLQARGSQLDRRPQEGARKDGISLSLGLQNCYRGRQVAKFAISDSWL